jgi:hypothetical protein
MELGAALADEDVAGIDDLAAELLDAEAAPAVSRPLREQPPAFLCAIANAPRPGSAAGDRSR